MQGKKKEGGLGIAILVILMLVAVGSGESIPESLPQPKITPTISPIPIGVEDENVWRVIDQGVKNAEANGIECDPFLLLALQQVFTGGVFCDETWRDVPRPNECACQEEVLGMFQIYTPTFERNALRYDVEGRVWDPAISAEIVCYFIHDEANISLDQTKGEFISEFVEKGFIWDIFPNDAEKVFNRGIELKELNSKGVIRRK